MSESKKTGLDLLREPFPDHQISKLPKPTISNDQWKLLPKSKCMECGGFHATSKTIHLDYVGHAALTDRLLDCDPLWTWEPLSLGDDGYPVIDKNGGMWIKLTVCGVTRLGYGDSQGKAGGNAVKECIGDALRNAAMRFGAALELWHKGDLHIEIEDEPRHPLAPKESAVGVAAAIRNDLDEATIRKCEGIAEEVEMLYVSEGVEPAFNLYSSVTENDEKTGVWSYLGSKTRSAIKTYGQSRGAMEKR